MKKMFLLIVVLSALSLLFTGCEKIELTEEEEDLVVAYGVSCVLKYDYNYPDKLLEPEPVREEVPTSGQASPEQPTPGSTTDPVDNPNPGYVSLDYLMNIPGFKFETVGYQVCKSYTDTQGSGQTMTSVDGKNLIVVKVKVKNISSAPAELNMVNKYQYKAIVNNSSRLNEQLWANRFTLNAFQGSFAANEEKLLVLAFQIDNSVDVKTVNLSVTVGDKSGTVALD